MGEKENEALQFTFNGFLKVAFQGSRETPPNCAEFSNLATRYRHIIRSRAAESWILWSSATQALLPH